MNDSRIYGSKNSVQKGKNQFLRFLIITAGVFQLSWFYNLLICSAADAAYYQEFYMEQKCCCSYCCQEPCCIHKLQDSATHHNPVAAEHQPCIDSLHSRPVCGGCHCTAP
jgi:hypothetical protein